MTKNDKKSRFNGELLKHRCMDDDEMHTMQELEHAWQKFYAINVVGKRLLNDP